MATRARADFAAPDPDAANKARFVAAYPEHLARFDAQSVVWKDGSATAWHDGAPDKSFDEKLARASLADQMSLPYKPGAAFGPPPTDFDPGRFRNEAFFKKVYGASEAAVRANLVEVPWHVGGHKGALAFTRINGVATIAKKLVAELATLPADLHKFVDCPAGSFDWRPIAGTDELSAHAFGIAVDITVRFSRYWRWDKPMLWSNAIPFEVIDIFERNGFIWGGKWFHYDTMHFEYRPELLAAT